MMNKKMLFKLGVGLTVIGLGITLIGFSLTGWQIEKYQETPRAWYRTVHFN